MKHILVFLSLFCMGQAYAGIKFSVDYNMNSLNDNATNFAMFENIDDATDTSDIQPSATGLGFSFGFEAGLFGLRGKYLLDQKTEVKTGTILNDGVDVGASSTSINWSGYAGDFYVIFMEKSMFRPYLGAGYLIATYKIEQDFNVTATLTGEDLRAEADKSSVYYFAGVDIMLGKNLGLGVQMAMYTTKITEFLLTQSFDPTANANRAAVGSVAKKLDNNGFNYVEPITADFGRTEITASLNYRF